MTFKTDNISIQGYSHILAEKECQDSSISWHTKKYAGLIVCDGHGGEKYIRSATGSKFACEIGKSAIDGFMNSIKNWTAFHPNIQFPIIERYIINQWRLAVEKDLQEHPLEDDEQFDKLFDADKAALLKSPIKAYGATFIAAVLTDKFYFILKLGDGNANVVFEDGNIVCPQELEDEQLQFNITTSLCQSNADVEFRHIFNKIDKDLKAKGLVLTTDGIINCFQSVKSYHSLIKNIFNAYEETKNQEQLAVAREELREGLNEFSKRGSGDDLSVAIGMIDL